ncbi:MULTISPECIES: DUF5658 family protein [Sporosarcina]|uniref:DUF5658 family protein n=1 Tax=Sporosarcina TaxID=1569 RepID=UPI000590EA1B|nr:MULTISPECIES: DUF5658 family protein [Sporosarcina]WJY27866.1 DUF5658 family protein [Sporosarcina sp. 0.2-SM1T-5]
MDNDVTERKTLMTGRWQLGLLLCLCTADALATDTGIRLGLIAESNPLMALLYEDSRLSFYLVKLAGPILLMALWSPCSQSPAVRRLLAAAIILYCSVLLLHACWIALSLIFLA